MNCSIDSNSIYFSFRVEEISLRDLLSVRSDLGHRGLEEPEDEGSGLRHLQGDQLGLGRPQVHAGIPLLRQAHENRIRQVNLGNKKQLLFRKY